MFYTTARIPGSVGSLEAPQILGGARNVHALVPHSRLEVVEGTAHNAYHQATDRMLVSFDDFVVEAGDRAGPPGAARR